MRCPRSLLCFALLAGLLGPSFVRADRPQTNEATIRRLIRQLGATDFEDRQAASAYLLEVGPEAIPHLLRAEAESRGEIARRAGQIARVLRKAEFEDRLTTFLRDPASAPPESLPGWEQMARWTGDTPQARELFALLLRHQAPLMETLLPDDEWVALSGGAWDPQSRRLEQQLRAADVEQRIGEHRTGDRYQVAARSDDYALAGILALVIVDLAVEPQTNLALPEQPTWNGGRIGMFNLLNQEVIRAALDAAHPQSVPVRALLEAWVRYGTSTIDERLQVGAQLRLPAALDPAQEIIVRYRAEPRSGEQRQLQIAMLIAAKYGTPELIPVLEPLLDDPLLLSSQRPSRGSQVDCRVQDVALLAILHLSGQHPKDFGFSRVTDNDVYGYSLNTASFESEAQRAAAQQQWNQWRVLHLERLLDIPVDAIGGTSL